ncbi:MAG: caspase family protein, partial [Hyphomicrobium sp.]
MCVLRRCLLAVLALTVSFYPAAAARRVALVVGNSAYVHASPLANPANDAADMAGKLKDQGFEVITGVDLDKRAFDAKIRDFSHALEQAETAMLFYAGHGLQIAGRNYLIPTDAKLERERDVEFEAVSLDFVLKQMEIDRDSKTSIIFLDACRNNPLARNLARSMGTRGASIGSG